MCEGVAAAVAAGDLDGLIRLVDGLCSAREWDGVLLLRDRSRQALERGLQLWPAAEYAEYRLALEAPPAFAGPVVVEGAGRFAQGPLWEVAAASRTWADLSPHLPGGPARTMAAHERVVRGEDLGADDSIDRSVLNIPLVIQPWEPEYPVAVYRTDNADFPDPAPIQAGSMTDLPAVGEQIDDQVSIEALVDLGRVWVDQSNGSLQAVAVAGDPPQAVSAAGHDAAAMTPIEPAAALAWMAWAGASGGAYGRRRGTPAGRFAAWWVVATMADLDWPPDPSAVRDAAAGLRWLWWEPPGPASGWALRLAVGHPAEGISWAVEATDSYRDEDVLAEEA